MLRMIGDTIRNRGMVFTLVEVDLTKNNKPIYFLRRNFDGSIWYTNTPYANRFTNLSRVYDRRNAYLDRYDVMVGMNEMMRRL